MIRSMTGFGNADLVLGEQRWQLEIRTVNQRFLDLRLRLPRLFAACEGELRTRLQEALPRGRVEVALEGRAGGASAQEVLLDLTVARRYLEAARSLRESAGARGDLEVADLLALPGVTRLLEPESAGEAARGALRAALEQALAGLDAMRRAEGANLARDLNTRLAAMEQRLDRIEGRSAEVQAATRERLRRRAEQLRGETGLFDEARLHHEIVLAADRLDVCEEVVRLRSHIAQFRDLLADPAGGPLGRRLEFLLQEFGREANTIGSKVADAPLAHEVVDLKVEIERLREQVQNVE